MYKYADPTATLLGEFTDGDLLNNVAPTILRAAWVNMIQRELLALVNGAGLTPSPADNSQVLQAVQQIVAQYVSGSVIIPPATVIANNEGDSTTAAISQKAATDALVAIRNSVLGKAETAHTHSISHVDGLAAKLAELRKMDIKKDLSSPITVSTGETYLFTNASAQSVGFTVLGADNDRFDVVAAGGDVVLTTPTVYGGKNKVRAGSAATFFFVDSVCYSIGAESAL